MSSKIPLVDLKAQYQTIKDEIDAAIARVVANTAFILGDEVTRFEAAFAEYVGADAAAGVASGTAALQLALLACGVGPGDEVITTAHTFFATGEAISNVGARPVFADIDPATFNIDPNAVEDAITDRTRALLPVHLYGHPAAMDELAEIAGRRGLRLIEDAAQAHGAEYKGRKVGSIGDLACFSFYPGKNLGAYGDAGAVTGNDVGLIERVRTLRNHGRASKYEHDEVGLAERMDGLQGAILAAKLPHLTAWTEARRAHAARYSQLLADSPHTLPIEIDGARHVWHLYVLRIAGDRDAALAHLHEHGVGAGVHYPIPLHRQPAYAPDYADVSLPHTESAASQVLSLPLYPELSTADQDRVVECLLQL